MKRKYKAAIYIAAGAAAIITITAYLIWGKNPRTITPPPPPPKPPIPPKPQPQDNNFDYSYYSSDEATTSDEPITYMKVKTNGDNLNIRQRPDIKSTRLNSIKNGVVIRVNKLVNGWYEIPPGYYDEGYLATIGYVSSAYLERY